jgi:hypothetical protein
VTASESVLRPPLRLDTQRTQSRLAIESRIGARISHPAFQTGIKPSDSQRARRTKREAKSHTRDSEEDDVDRERVCDHAIQEPGRRPPSPKKELHLRGDLAVEEEPSATSIAVLSCVQPVFGLKPLPSIAESPEHITVSKIQ